MKVVCRGQRIIDHNIKKARLFTTLQDCALTWYIKYCTDNPLVSLEDTQTDLDKEFGKSNS